MVRQDVVKWQALHQFVARFHQEHQLPALFTDPLDAEGLGEWLLSFQELVLGRLTEAFEEFHILLLVILQFC